jgi:2-polyprenyl-6-methoxyphenol hydroxylase-like FAD-dependent oxidoreductase
MRTRYSKRETQIDAGARAGILGCTGRWLEREVTNKRAWPLGDSFMPSEEQIDVLVVGAGPVGMLNALLLAENGVQVRIIDQERRTASRTYACAMHSRALQLMDAIGFGREILAAGRRIDKVAFYEESTRRAEIKLGELAGAYPHVLVLAQSALEESLERQLRRQWSVQVEWNHHLSELRQDGDNAVATVEKIGVSAKGYIIPEMEWTVEKATEIRAAFVVGADGAASTVAHSLNTGYDSIGEPEFYAVFEFKSDWDSGDELRVVLDKDTTSVLWPLPGGRFRWSFQLREEHLREFPAKERSPVVVDQPGMTQANRQFIEKLVSQRAPWFKGAIQDLGWSTDVEFGHRVAKRFGQGRCWLAGDAAHQTGPGGMQSMNVGLFEAQQLAEIIKKVQLEKAPISLFDTYNNSCRREWERLLGINGKINATPQANDWVRERSARILPCIPAAGDDLAKLARQIGLDLQ